MAVEKFHGKYVTATDALSVVDMPTIDEGCQMLREASEKLNKLSDKINALKDMCDRDALSIGGENMEALIEEYERRTKDFSLYINDLSETLQNTTQRVFNRKQTIFNDEARKLEKEEELRRNEISIETTPVVSEEENIRIAHEMEEQRQIQEKEQMNAEIERYNKDVDVETARVVDGGDSLEW